MTTENQAPEGAQALLVQALEDIIEPFAYIERNLPEGYRLDGQAALQQINSREFYTRIAKEALAAHRAALAAPAPQAPVALTDAVLKGAAEYWHEYGDGPGAEVSRRKAALLAFKAGARFAEGRHGITQTKEPRA